MRLALDLMRRDAESVARFTEAIRTMREQVKYCEVCCNISDTPVCRICQDHTRDRSLICVVEDIRDVIAIEQTRQFRGTYHVLGGTISPMDGIGPDDLNIPPLLERLSDGQVKELVLALGADLEGDTTAFFLHRRTAGMVAQVSTIARGISIGGELDQADEVTLGRSIMDRKPYSSK